jgi:predicted TIM-barrel fold metal-dependent hydrolase
MIIDSQIHIWAAPSRSRPWPQAGAGGRTAEPHRVPPFTAQDVIKAMDRAGVDRAILIPPSWEGERNDVALAAAHAWPARFAVMGRIADDASANEMLGWRSQGGMMGVRIILARTSAWVARGPGHPLWRIAEEADVPVMLATAGHTRLAAEIARRHPKLRIALDHMGTGILRDGFDPFADAELVFELAREPNVAIKLSALPCYSKEARPWADVMPYVRRLFDLYGSQRLFWGSDLSRLPCPYAELVDHFLHGVPWLKGQALDDVMGEALAAWLQ